MPRVSYIFSCVSRVPHRGDAPNLRPNSIRSRAHRRGSPAVCRWRYCPSVPPLSRFPRGGISRYGTTVVSWVILQVLSQCHGGPWGIAAVAHQLRAVALGYGQLPHPVSRLRSGMPLRYTSTIQSSLGISDIDSLSGPRGGGRSPSGTRRPPGYGPPHIGAGVHWLKRPAYGRPHAARLRAALVRRK